MRIGLGIDTGGTYTDSVLLDLETGQVIRKEKALTTYPNLEVGIADALNGLMFESQEAKDQQSGSLLRFSPQEITLVAVSTTLATNAMVEDKGRSACLLAVGLLPNLLEKKGLDQPPFIELRHLAGGHNADGEERHALDLAAAERAIEETKDSVEAYAVAALGSSFNPSHEIRLVELVREKTILPVVSGIEFSRELNSIKRAITALLNARLLPLVRQFITAMSDLLLSRNISAPLMIVKGNGHLMRAELALEHPIETVLSGPSASFIGGRHLSDCQDGIVLDMGGTTTDIAVLKDGLPRIVPDGAIIAGWRTCVRAAEVHTSGIGGDSHLQLKPADETRQYMYTVAHCTDAVSCGPRRVIPLAFAAVQYPDLLNQLQELESSGWHSSLVQPCDFLMFRQSEECDNRSQTDVALRERLHDGPRSLWHLTHELEILHPSLLNTKESESKGDLIRIGLTPTDVLHVTGVFTDWCVEAAERGIRLYAKRLQRNIKETISILQTTIDQKIITQLVTVLLNHDGVSSEENSDENIRDFLVKQILSHENPSRLQSLAGVKSANIKDIWSIDTKMHLPLIGIGAPVQAHLPPLASLLRTEVIIPEHAEVANAVGAIVGRIVETVEIDIHPVYSVAGIDRYEVRSPVQVRTFRDRKLALRYAVEHGEQLVIDKAKRAGAEQVEAKIEHQHREAPTEDGQPIYLGTRIQAVGSGNQPKVAPSDKS